MPVIADNPRKKGKSRRIEPSGILRKKRYVFEQFNGHVKDNVLGECWIRPKGLARKAVRVTVGLIGCNAEAIRSLISGEISLKSLRKSGLDTIVRRL